MIKRFGEEGLSCFIEKSRRPHGHPNKTSVSIENSIISLKQKHKYWGARKIRKLLESSYGHEELPSQTTIHGILKRNGLVKSRKRRGHRLVCVNPKFDPKRCNEIWSADYKGKFKLGNRRYCHALTVCYPEKPPRYDYPNGYKKLRVTSNGAIRWGAYNWVYISRGARKRYVGVKEIGEGIWQVYYRAVFLGRFDETKLNRKEQYLKLHF